jgi:hypothetical protein
MYYKKDNAKFLKVTILFSQHEHRILTGQKPYCKRVLPLFSKHYLFFLLTGNSVNELIQEFLKVYVLKIALLVFMLNKLTQE